jgi:hypothetical protein
MQNAEKKCEILETLSSLLLWRGAEDKKNNRQQIANNK